jgi:predicted component of type VI protein secretion system
MDKCPVCGADTRPGDNYCLNCGQRLLPNTPSPLPVQQAQPPMGDAAQEYQDQGLMGGTIPAGPPWAADPSAPTVAASQPDLPTLREATLAATAQATLDRIENPARFLLRAENGETLQEYTLDKAEMVIGRAPTSDILLSKDKLTSRRHATVRHENGQYYLSDDHSANGTFVNGQQIEDTASYLLHDGDQVGIGEHELVFHSSQAPALTIEDIPTRLVPFGVPQQELTYRTREDSLATIPSPDDYGTRTMEEHKEKEEASIPSSVNSAVAPVEEAPTPSPVAEPIFHAPPAATMPVSVELSPQEQSPSLPVAAVQTSSYPSTPDGVITFARLTNVSQPALPEMSALMAALSKLDGEIMSLQEQFNTTQEAMHQRDEELVKNANELRNGILRVADRMDNTIADVARSREALAWAELLQLMDDVMSNPRDIEYVTKLARKARELNKVFQIHQNVLNTMAECNSLLRSMIGSQESHS